MKRILVVEPYYGGSHKLFLEGLCTGLNKKAELVFMTLPARKWKMRMQLSAFWFRKELEAFKEEERFFDIVLCSTFVDVAVLRVELEKLTGWNRQCCFNTYFHENQFVYPSRHEAENNQQFTAINFTTAQASHGIAFNSLFNRDSFLSGCSLLLKKAADMKLKGEAEKLKKKAEVIYPGLDFSIINVIERERKSSKPIIVWNHRWEHDKGPEFFFSTLYQLKKEGVAFRLVVLGEVFSDYPQCFEEAKELLAEEILHFGYASSRKEYVNWLVSSDVVVSTSLHEFYGISVIEAVRAGCRPLLPNRLSYPELFPEEYLYKDGQMKKKLIAALYKGRLGRITGEKLTEQFSWENVLHQYEQWLNI